MSLSRKENCVRGARFARKVIDTRMPLRKIRDLTDKVEAARGHPEIFEKVRRDNARKYRGFEAWKGALRAVQARGRPAVRPGNATGARRVS